MHYLIEFQKYNVLQFSYSFENLDDMLLLLLELFIDNHKKFGVISTNERFLSLQAYLNSFPNTKPLSEIHPYYQFHFTSGNNGSACIPYPNKCGSQCILKLHSPYAPYAGYLYSNDDLPKEVSKDSEFASKLRLYNKLLRYSKKDLIKLYQMCFNLSHFSSVFITRYTLINKLFKYPYTIDNIAIL